MGFKPEIRIPPKRHSPVRSDGDTAVISRPGVSESREPAAPSLDEQIAKAHSQLSAIEDYLTKIESRLPGGELFEVVNSLRECVLRLDRREGRRRDGGTWGTERNP